MTDSERKLFSAVRKQVADYITEYLKDDCGHKSYEGTWELLVSFPSYFDDDTATASPDFYRVTLHCYVLGPHRHYNWDGKSFMEALNKCKHNIGQWIKKT